jgi:hypothetical protein
MNARVDGTPLRATRLEQNVEGVGDDPAPGARSIYLEQFASQMDLNFAVFRYVSKYGAPQGCQANQESAVATLYVNSWLSGYYYSLDGMPEPSRLQALRSLTAKQGNKWFRDHSDSYFDCTLTLSALP